MKWTEICKNFNIVTVSLIHYPFRGITMNLLSFSLGALGKHYLFWEFTITIEHYRFRKITIKSLFISWITIHQKSFSWIRIESTIFPTNHFWIQYLLRELNLNWPSIHYPFRGITMNLLSFSLNHCEYTNCFPILLCIHYLFREFTLNPLSFSQIHYETLSFSEIHYLFREWTKNSLWIHYLFRDFTLDDYLIPEITMNALLFLQNQYEFTISFSRNHVEFTILFTLSLSKHYLFRDFTMNTLYFGNLE